MVDSNSASAAAAAIRGLVEAYRQGDGDAVADLLRLDEPGLSHARNAGARAARAAYICYIDDDAIPSPNLVEMALQAITGADRAPALIGGRILPLWEAPLPRWWPARLRGVLSIVEDVGAGEYRSADLPPGLEPCGANFVVHVPALLAVGGFSTDAGRCGAALLSDEEVQLAWRLQQAGHSVRYDSTLMVRHRIQAARLSPAWLLSRLHWQGVSAVITRVWPRMLRSASARAGPPRVTSHQASSSGPSSTSSSHHQPPPSRRTPSTCTTATSSPTGITERTKPPVAEKPKDATVAPPGPVGQPPGQS